MARPLKQRYVGTPPRVGTFKPRGIAITRLEAAILSLDELEALKLADLQRNSQEEAAVKMNVSRPTFGRILDKAHRTVADALLHGKALEIGGGTVKTARRGRVRCRRCSRAWEIPLAVTSTFQCPRCPKKS
jgi:predicted DNA-binding protein (UPF0251 family)